MSFKCFLYMLFTALILTCPVAKANSYQELSAEFMLAGQIAYGDVEEGQSHLYIKIKGSDAMKLFNAMNVKEVKNDCLDLIERTQGNISCYRADNEKDSYCIFAVDIEKNKIEIGETC